MAEVDFLILGGGYTGRRVAAILARQEHRVTTTSSRTFDVTQPGAWIDVPTGARVLHSIPVRAMPVAGPMLRGWASRVVYLSTTGVYGAARDVDETTAIAPRNPREQVRAEEEADVLAGPWSALVLRPAAIYGPGRGVHVSLREGRHRILGDGSNYISRIHVDDLAAIAAAALLSDLTGAYPVADEEPCTALEMTRFCSDLLGLPVPPAAPLPDADTRSANRRVDGRAICRILGVTLRYPSYRVGVPASLALSDAAPAVSPIR